MRCWRLGNLHPSFSDQINLSLRSKTQNQLHNVEIKVNCRTTELCCVNSCVWFSKCGSCDVMACWYSFGPSLVWSQKMLFHYLEISYRGIFGAYLDCICYHEIFNYSITLIQDIIIILFYLSYIWDNKIVKAKPRDNRLKLIISNYGCFGLFFLGTPSCSLM